MTDTIHDLYFVGSNQWILIVNDGNGNLTTVQTRINRELNHSDDSYMVQFKPV